MKGCLLHAGHLAPAANLRRRQSRTRTQPRLWEGLDDEAYAVSGEEELRAPTEDRLIFETSRALRRASWLSWWSQSILTTVSSVILLFARGVLGRGANAAAPAAAMANPNLWLSGLGLSVSFVSLLWTWGNGARLSRRLLRPPSVSRFRAASLLRRAIRVGCTLNLLGLLLHLLAAEQIVGSLAVKVLARGGVWEYGASAASASLLALQPIDVLVVQANTNALLSHFVSLALLLYLTDRVRLLDPPSSSEGVAERSSKKTR